MRVCTRRQLFEREALDGPVAAEAASRQPPLAADMAWLFLATGARDSRRCTRRAAGA
jgi:hypothetical protein